MSSTKIIEFDYVNFPKVYHLNTVFEENFLRAVAGVFLSFFSVSKL